MLNTYGCICVYISDLIKIWSQELSDKIPDELERRVNCWNKQLFSQDMLSTNTRKYDKTHASSYACLHWLIEITFKLSSVLYTASYRIEKLLQISLLKLYNNLCACFHIIFKTILLKKIFRMLTKLSIFHEAAVTMLGSQVAVFNGLQ